MNQELIHVYFMPGMAANPKIFEYVELPTERFKVHYLEWFIPNPKESLSGYAERMSQFIKHDKAVLIGVSFGGILVQEMKAFLDVRKVIIISSVKTRFELPKRMKILRKTGAYKLIPTQLASNIDALAKYAFGKVVTKRIELYKKYLSVSDKRYLDWAIRQIMLWERTEIDQEVIHIHGEKDAVFPISNLTEPLIVKGGTHIMIINKYKWFNEHLPELILR